MLRFDAWQRYTQVSEILREVFPGRPRSLLDVGGGTGQSLGLPEDWTQISVDVHPAGTPDFVQGSADRLPFADAGVDIVISLDTLEHLPGDRRDSAVTEMMRVASEAILIAGPFRSDGVVAAERSIDNLHRNLAGRPHPWLAEHLQAPLPDLAHTQDLLKSQDCTVYKTPCGYLPVWLFLMTVGEILEARPNSMELADTLDGIYRERIYPFDQLEPAYRSILLGVKSGVDSAEMLPPRGDPALVANGLCEAISEAAPVLGYSIVGGEGSPSPDCVGSSPYTRRLEQAIESWEVACGEAMALAEKGHRRMAELERRRSFRVYRRFMAFFGRSV